MSFLGGAECSTASNPLSRFTKHVQDDKSLQRDRLVNQGPGLQDGMRSHAVGGSHQHIMDEFMREQPHLPQAAGPVSPFAMEQMRRELEQASRAQHSASPAWATEFGAGRTASPVSSRFSATEFANFERMSTNASERTAAPGIGGPTAMMGYQRPMYNMGMGMGMSGATGASVIHDQRSRIDAPDTQDWEAHFAQLEKTGQQDAEADAVNNQTGTATEAELSDVDRSVRPETDKFGDLESIWKAIQAEDKRSSPLVDEQEATTHLHMGDGDEWSGFGDLHTRSSLPRPDMGDYLFEQDNPFQDVTDPFKEGVAILQSGGNLSLAALAFEAAVQKDAQHVEAWTKLGAAQAQNEKESPAIRALEQALKLEPDNLNALMGLGVSYTNEGYDSTAYRTLERWLATKYPQLIKPEDVSTAADVGFTDRHAQHEKVTNLFIKAAQLSPSGEHMDPDVQVGLGVLFYGAEEYEKAVDCFGAALASTETGTSNQQDQLHLLWNRLGATLANSGRCEEAIDAYERALELRPNFVRARYNLGVSCINMGCHTEAAQHLLGAIAMHRIVEQQGRDKACQVVGESVDEAELDRMISQNQSTNLYDTLRRVFGHMNRRDLGDLVGAGMDIERFRQEFEF